jgi:hypothetical protein
MLIDSLLPVKLGLADIFSGREYVSQEEMLTSFGILNGRKQKSNKAAEIHGTRGEQISYLRNGESFIFLSPFTEYREDINEQLS